MRQHLLRHPSKHQPRLLQPIERARRAPVADRAIRVSDGAMAAETTPPVIAAMRTQVLVGTGTTIVVTATTVIEAIGLKVASEAKAPCEQKVAAMAAVIPVVKVGALASAPHVAAVVTDHAAKVGRTQVAGWSKAFAEIRMGAPIKVFGRIRVSALTRAADSIKAHGAISLRARINQHALIRADGPTKPSLATTSATVP
jgi:hypothetical protein